MPAAQKVVARVPSMDTDPIFIAVEMSRSKWVVWASPLGVEGRDRSITQRVQ